MNQEEILERVDELLNQCDVRRRLSNDFKSRLEECKKAREILNSLEGSSPKVERLRLALLSQINIQESYILDALGMSEKNLELAKEALTLAEESMDPIQIARAHLSLGIHLLNRGEILDADSYWVKILLDAEDYSKDVRMQIVVGRTLIVRGHVLNAKGLFAQAIEVLDDAIKTLELTGDRIGTAEAYELMAKVYHNLSDYESTEQCMKLAKELKARAQLEVE